MKRKIAMLLALTLAFTSGAGMNGVYASVDDGVLEIEETYPAEFYVVDEDGEDEVAGGIIEPLEETDGSGLPAYVQDDNPNPEVVSTEDMERYIEDGSWEERVSFMERLHEEQEQLTGELLRKQNADSAEWEDEVPEERDYVDALGYAESVTGISHTMPAEGEVKTLMLEVSFKDYAFDDSYNAKDIFSDGDANSTYYPEESLTAYYKRSSYDKLNLTGEVVPIKLEENRSYYDDKTASNRLLNNDVSDAIYNYITGLDEYKDMNENAAINAYMSQFDQDGDFVVDGSYILYAGPHTGWGSQWWAYRYNPYVKIGDYYLSNMVMVFAFGKDNDWDYTASNEEYGNDDEKRYEYWKKRWEEYKADLNPSEACQTLVHETGHMLGLDDYYAYDSGDAMGSGYVSDMMNDNVGDHNAFSKVLLGWIDKDEITWKTTEEDTVTLSSYSNADSAEEAAKGFVFITTPEERAATKDNKNGIYSQFILAEYFTNERNDAMYDEGKTYPNRKQGYSTNSGIRLFHIDARLNDSGTKFAASNPDSNTYINYIMGYDANAGVRKSTDTIILNPVYGEGDTLSAADTWFWYNPSGDGKRANSYKEYTGITLSDFNASESGCTFKLGMGTAPSATFDIVTTEGVTSSVKATFDRQVAVNSAEDQEEWDGAILYEAGSDGSLGQEIQSIKRKDITVSDDGRTATFPIDSTKLNNGKYILYIPQETFKTTGDDSVSLAYHVIIDNKADENFPAVPEASKKGGLYKEYIEGEGGVSLTSETGDAVIYYTTDESDPSKYNEEGSTAKKYESPIEIKKSLILKAVAVSGNGDNARVSGIMSEKYTIEVVKPTETMTLYVDETQFILGSYSPDTEIAYQSSDTKVAGVDSRGRVTGRGEGTAKITLIAANTTAEVTVTVKKLEDDATGDTADAMKEAKSIYGDSSAAEIANIVSNFENEGSNLGEIYTQTRGTDATGSYIWTSPINSGFTYTGSAIIPDITVYDGLRALTIGTDYTLSCSNNKNVGKEGAAKLRVRFKGNYKGTPDIVKNFTITKLSLGDSDSVKVFDVSVPYTGKAQKPVPVVVACGKMLAKSNFTITYKDENGESVKSVKGAGVYTGTLTAKNKNLEDSYDFSITVTDDSKSGEGSAAAATVYMKNLKVNLSGKSFVYTGMGINPDVTVKDKKGNVIPQKDAEGKSNYSVEYFYNTDPGKAIAVVTGSGTYAGQKTLTYTIKKGKDIDSASMRYNSELFDGKLTVYYSKTGAFLGSSDVVITDYNRKTSEADGILEEGTDYTLSYKLNKALSTGDTKAKVIVKGKGNYKGTKTFYFTVEEASINPEETKDKNGNSIAGNSNIYWTIADKITAAPETDYKNPTVTILDNGKKLKAGTDFEIDTESYKKEEGSNVVSVTINGKGNYTGSIEGSYLVISADKNIKNATVGKLKSYTFNSPSVTPDASDFKDFLKLKNENNYLIYREKDDNGNDPMEDGFFIENIENNNKAGTATITLRGCGKYGGTKTVKFKIVAKKGTQYVYKSE